MARALMAAGLAIFLAGAVLWLASLLGIRLGKLPGDFSWEGKNIRIYAPWATMIIVSAVLTVLLNVVSRIWRK